MINRIDSEESISECFADDLPERFDGSTAVLRGFGSDYGEVKVLTVEEDGDIVFARAYFEPPKFFRNLVRSFLGFETVQQVDLTEEKIDNADINQAGSYDQGILMLLNAISYEVLIKYRSNCYFQKAVNQNIWIKSEASTPFNREK